MIAYVIIALVALQRLAELEFAQRNTRRLLARGGIEVGAAHYPFFILLHSGWLISMAYFLPRNSAVSWWLIGVFALLQAGRVWAIASLGEYWTTRLITVPGAPLVRRGPYRFLRHPNYVVAIGEIAVLPLALGEPAVSLVFSVLNALLLSVRIRTEEETLAKRQS